MSRLEELLQTLCPDGVENKQLGNIGSFYGGLTGKTKQDFQDGNRKFISYMNVYKNSAVDTTTRDFVRIEAGERQNTVEYGDILFTGSSETPEECGITSVMVKHPDEPFYLNSFTIGYRLHDPNLLNPEFSKHLFRSDGLRKQINKTANGVTRFNVSKAKLAGVEIPLPPLPVQEEIVRILDTFTNVVEELETELEAEQAARVRQYEHYRNELLSFDSKSRIMEKLFAEQCLDRVQYVKLKEVAHISAGGDLPENYVKGQKVPTEQFPFPIYSNGTDDNALYGFTDNYKIEKEAVTISARGTIGYHEVRAGKFTPIVRLITMIADESKITTKFLNYVLNIAGIEGVNTGIPSLTVPMLEKITIPLPPLPIQEQIVSILDHFDALVNDLKTGLPAEIALRRKQYEYYRDKLLTFEPKQPPL